MKALARRTDAHTSHDAAREADTSGRAGAQREVCLNAVRQWPGLTAAEIAVQCRLERHVPSRRLPELRDAGLVTNGPARTCAKTGRKSLTWFCSRPTRQSFLF